MAKRDIVNFDASDRAASELEYVLRKPKAADEAPRVSVEEAIKQPRIIKAETRDTTRVLFVSQDESLLNPEHQSLDGYVELRDLFEEVHIVLLRQGIPPKDPVIRPCANVWIYTVAAKTWLFTPHAAIKLIAQELVFASGFRPDLVIARDPFESAVVADKVGRLYDRPTQVHILEDFLTDAYIKKNRRNKWRRLMARFMIPRFISVRAATSLIAEKIAKQYKTHDLQVLPRFHHYESLITIPRTINLTDIYQPYVFLILFIGTLSHTSTLYRAIDAARFALRNPRVGLLVLGDGPAKGEFQKRAEIQGVARQVIFESRATDIVPYLKSANLLLVTDTDAESDEVVLKGAAAGIPAVMAKNPKREDIFEHGVSAFLYDDYDVQGFAKGIGELLNSTGLRKVFIDNAQMTIVNHFHQDPELYKEAYRTSIEDAMFLDNSPVTPPRTA